MQIYIYIYMFISPHDFAVDLFEDRPLNAKPFEAALAHHSSSPEIIDLIRGTLMDLASGKAVRKNRPNTSKKRPLWIPGEP